MPHKPLKVYIGRRKEEELFSGEPFLSIRVMVLWRVVWFRCGRKEADSSEGGGGAGEGGGALFPFAQIRLVQKDDIKHTRRPNEGLC